MALSNSKTHRNATRCLNDIDKDKNLLIQLQGPKDMRIAQEGGSMPLSVRRSIRKDKRVERRLYKKALRNENKSALKEATNDALYGSEPGTTTSKA